MQQVAQQLYPHIRRVEPTRLQNQDITQYMQLNQSIVGTSAINGLQLQDRTSAPGCTLAEAQAHMCHVQDCQCRTPAGCTSARHSKACHDRLTVDRAEMYSAQNPCLEPTCPLLSCYMPPAGCYVHGRMTPSKLYALWCGEVSPLKLSLVASAKWLKHAVASPSWHQAADSPGSPL
jgi:hypothetical protein